MMMMMMMMMILDDDVVPVRHMLAIITLVNVA